VLTLAMNACGRTSVGKTSKEHTLETKQVQTDPNRSPIVVHNICDLDGSLLSISVAITLEHVGMNKGLYKDEPKNGPRREYYAIECVQCVDEKLSYNIGTAKACEEFSWECNGLMMEVGELDKGVPLRASTARLVPVETASRLELMAASTTLLENFTDRTRFSWVDDTLRGRGIPQASQSS